jgi:hypothetical protein
MVSVQTNSTLLIYGFDPFLARVVDFGSFGFPKKPQWISRRSELFNSKVITTLMVLLIVLVAGSAFAGAKLQVGDDSYIDLGYRLQTYFQSTDANLDSSKDGYESYSQFRVRRARLRLKGVVNEKVSVFLQTDAAGKDVKLIDAFLTYKPGSDWFQFVMGRNMAPSSRQATTSSGALMALDRPLQTANALNWGAGGAVNAGGGPLGNGEVRVTTDAVRDNGLTLFGSNALGGNSLKYYLGLYNGVMADGDVSDKHHVAFRAQFNLWDAEAGYYNSSTYLGKKKTLGIGVSYDNQGEVGRSQAAAAGDPDILVDYTLMSADAFLELPFSGGGALTAELGVNSLDFDDAVDFMSTQGSGFYGQAGYYFASGFQPWVLYESYSSDATAYTAANAPIPEAVGKVDGDYTNLRVGVTYFIDGQHANIKLAYGSRTSDVPVQVGGTTEDTKNTITLGFFTTY